MVGDTTVVEENDQSKRQLQPSVSRAAVSRLDPCIPGRDITLQPSLTLVPEPKIQETSLSQ